MRFLIKSASLLIFFLLLPAVSFGTLGDTRDSAESKSGKWERKYGAIAPIIKTNQNGKVVQECWSAPSQGWKKTTALDFAKELLPTEVRKTKPKQLAVDGHQTIFTVEENYKIYLSDFNGKTYDVEITSTAYKGYRC